jgi:hypothetical protein
MFMAIRHLLALNRSGNEIGNAPTARSSPAASKKPVPAEVVKGATIASREATNKLVDV